MIADRGKLVAWSIAALDDRASIGARPLDEIKADLTRLGIDPETSIRAAQKRAYEQSGPAERLLARLDDAETLASEIDALEKADIGDISARVKRGLAASAVAKARQHAGLPSNVTALRTPGRRFRGWGGSVVGLAACLLLFVLTRPDQLYHDGESMLYGVDDSALFSELEDAELDRAPDAPEEPAAVHEARRVRKMANVQDSQEARPAETAQRLSRSSAAPSIRAFAPSLERDTEPATASIVGQGGPKAILIVDPEKAPSELKTYARALPAGNLADRLDEARALLENRPLVALLTVLRDRKEVDVAVTLRNGTGPTRALSSFADSAAIENQAEIGSQDVRLEIIDLPGLP